MIRGKPTMLIRQSMEKLLNFVQLTVRVIVKDLTRNNVKIRSESGSTFSQNPVEKSGQDPVNIRFEKHP